MAHNPELFDTREQEYDVATWLGLLPIMESIGNLYINRTDKSTSLGNHALRICYAIEQKPDHLITNVKQWASNGRDDKPRVNALKQLEIINDDTSLNEDFETAYDIFTDQGWGVDLRSNSSFGTLLPIASELADEYEPQVRESLVNKIDLMYTFANVKRDINFFIGLYDPRR